MNSKLMHTSRNAVLAILTVLAAAVARPAADPIASTSIGRFAIEAFGLPIQEKVDICSGAYPELQDALNAASAELRKRYATHLVERLRTEKFASLLAAEVPDELFLLNRQQSAMRRNVNTTISRDRCEQMPGEFTQMSDQLLDVTIDQLLTPTKSIIDRRASRSSQ